MFNQRFEKLNDMIRNSKNITISIKKNAVFDFSPTVYQIDTDIEKNIYNYRSSNSSKILSMFILITVGVLIIFASFIYRKNNI